LEQGSTKHVKFEEGDESERERGEENTIPPCGWNQSNTKKKFRKTEKKGGQRIVQFAEETKPTGGKGRRKSQKLAH